MSDELLAEAEPGGGSGMQPTAGKEGRVEAGHRLPACDAWSRRPQADSKPPPGPALEIAAGFEKYGGTVSPLVSRAARRRKGDVGFADRIDSADSAITKKATGSRGDHIITPAPDTFTSSSG